MYKYILLFNGRSAEFTDLKIALHVIYLITELCDVYIVEYPVGRLTEHDELIGITSIKRRVN